MNLIKCIPILFVAGCTTVGPDFQQPDIDISQSYIGVEQNAQRSEQLTVNAWWLEFNDPVLNGLIERGLKQNLDIAAAKERIREAEAVMRTTGINAQLDGSADTDYLRSGGEGTSTDNVSTTSLSATFVIDLFGGISREREAAIADLAAAEADLETTRLAWLADLVSAYLDARYYQKTLTLTNETIRSRMDTVDITDLQYRAGASTEYDLVKAQALLESARADYPGYIASLNANIFSIATLLNEPADKIMQEVQQNTVEQNIPSTPGYGVPADLLRNRPDIHYYESLLHAAVADVGVATADMYPSLTLTGDISTIDGDGSWSFGPALSLPIFNQGALRAQKDVKLSVAKQAEIDWRSAVIDAVEDVQVSISNFTQYQTQSDALKKSSDFYSKALLLAQQNFRDGAITLLDLLDTDRSAASAKISAASAINETTKEWVTLQIAMGAGSKVIE
ncbi:efflux transporter outer membrane subunit [Vibrio natriegens]|uniref:efflux transporter outer membrane subunit n=2 Tax=Vibrio natriegens TaxID=691 RepID=UPI0003575F1E|nr:efflux transporter outer membrane subunit [Vibrio natriegens]ALR18116.1 RND transporter [Vibrio natriegens NBRC 15636 = ATCC 14048 = DSM 759]EPM41592.1 hypothetical protein M272_08465 [Vibrio natriegens NBRC 15636 = ATCC 14048 = DSM 759]MDX6029012.1 efflux transporter outer membrane subunit [Vibrio natriegens NBRC 15636 = ATCC 14048 = DSM 759]UUI14277.1 efflux transporter outer membrane subunit [Vibrio natriegens]WRS50915.1 efflux transporter outer membrane subunit [Vibrio natriegens NBRC 1